MLAGPGPDVDDPVGRSDRLLVVFDDEHRVAEIAQAGQGRDQLRVVTLVEPDRRLVEDVQDAHERRADLGREPDALGLTAGQGDARAVHRQVVETDIDEEPQPGGDLLDHLGRDGPFPFVELRPKPAGPAQGVLDRHRRDVPDVQVADRDRQDLGSEPLASTRRAGLADHQLLDLGLDVVGIRLAVAALEVGDDPLEVGLVRALPAFVPVAHEDPLLVFLRIEQVVERLLRQLADRRIEIPAMGLAHGLDDLHPPRRVRGQQATDPERTPAEALLRARDQDRRIDLELGAQAGAARARAVRGVEREVAGLELVDREAVVRAAVLLAVALLLEGRRLAVSWRGGDQHRTLAEPQGRLDRIGQPGRVRVGHDQARLGIDRPAVVGALRALRRLGVAHDVAVDHDLDRVTLVLIELGGVGDVVQLPVDPDANEPLAPGAIDDSRSPSVLRSLISGPRTRRRVPSGRATTWSTICWTLCRSIAWPLGQCGMPIRANNSRRWS